MKTIIDCIDETICWFVLTEDNIIHLNRKILSFTKAYLQLCGKECFKV